MWLKASIMHKFDFSHPSDNPQRIAQRINRDLKDQSRTFFKEQSIG